MAFTSEINPRAPGNLFIKKIDLCSIAWTSWSRGSGAHLFRQGRLQRICSIFLLSLTQPLTRQSQLFDNGTTTSTAHWWSFCNHCLHRSIRRALVSQQRVQLRASLTCYSDLLIWLRWYANLLAYESRWRWLCLGVLWSGDHLFPGTVETLQLLRSKGLIKLFVPRNLLTPA